MAPRAGRVIARRSGENHDAFGLERSEPPDCGAKRLAPRHRVPRFGKKVFGYDRRTPGNACTDLQIGPGELVTEARVVPIGKLVLPDSNAIESGRAVGGEILFVKRGMGGGFADRDQGIGHYVSSDL